MYEHILTYCFVTGDYIEDRFFHFKNNSEHVPMEKCLA